MVLEHANEVKVNRVKFIYINNFKFDTFMFPSDKDNEMVLIQTGLESGLTSKRIQESLDATNKLLESAKRKKDVANYFT